MKRILVTGGAGFIGSNLCEELLKDDNEVICVDNFFTGRRTNIKHLINNNNFELIRHDITLPLIIEMDQIYNLACPASPIQYQKNPVKTIKMSTQAVINMLGLAKRTGARILQASTSEIYGDPLEHPQKESYWGNVNPIGPRACYDEGKRVAETLMVSYNIQNKVDIRIARIFNTYGPKMDKDDGRVISNFIMQAIRNNPITIFGDGTQTRSFCYITDTVNGLIKLMNSKRNEGPVNIGNPQENTMLALAKLIKDKTQSKSNITFNKLPPDDPRKRCPDISKAKQLLGWVPQIPLTKGLDLTIKWFKDTYGRC